MNKIDIMLNKTIKYLSITIICIMLIIASIFIFPCSFADTVEFLEISTTEDFISNPTINYSEVYYTASVDIYPVSDVEGVFCFMVSSPSGSNTKHTLYYESSREFRYNQYNGSIWQLTTATATLKETGYYEYVTSVYSGPNYGSKTFHNINEFETYQDGIDALSTYLSGNANIDVGYKTVVCEPGYAVYILTNGGSAELTTTFSTYNNIFTGGWGRSTTQRIGISETRVPSSGYVFGANTGTLIPWTKLTTADTNKLGQTKVGHFIYNNCPDNGSYLVIYNPAYGYDDDITSNINNSIYIEVTNFVGANKFALKSQLALNGEVESSSPNNYTEFYTTGTGDDIVGDGNTLTWYPATSEDTDTTESITVFPDTPYNDTSSVPDNGTKIGQLVERIVDLLSAPIEHIQRLYNSAISFFTALSNLWIWLPPEVVAIISAALIVLVVIGAIKFLWK